MINFRIKYYIKNFEPKKFVKNLIKHFVVSYINPISAFSLTITGLMIIGFISLEGMNFLGSHYFNFLLGYPDFTKYLFFSGLLFLTIQNFFSFNDQQKIKDRFKKAFAVACVEAFILYVGILATIGNLALVHMTPLIDNITMWSTFSITMIVLSLIRKPLGIQIFNLCKVISSFVDSKLEQTLNQS